MASEPYHLVPSMTKYRKLKAGDKRPEGYEVRCIGNKCWNLGPTLRIGDEIAALDLRLMEYRVPIRPKKERKRKK